VERVTSPVSPLFTGLGPDCKHPLPARGRETCSAAGCTNEICHICVRVTITDNLRRIRETWPSLDLKHEIMSRIIIYPTGF